MNARVTRLLCAALAAGWLLGASAAEALQFKPLLAKDAHALLNGPRAHVLIVEIWSLDCSYCHENTARIVQWRRAHKLPVDVIMISMDSPDQADTLARALAPLARDPKVGLAHVAQYVNAEVMPERLRAALDPGWQGETPRTLFIGPDGARRASSGLLTPQALDAAFAPILH
jgi:hypothetical protein